MDIKKIVLDKVQALIKSKVTEDSTLLELKIDSLSLAELIVEAEEELNIRINDEELAKIKTIKDIISTIESSLNK